jgi:hypothetical protein
LWGDSKEPKLQQGISLWAQNQEWKFIAGNRKAEWNEMMLQLKRETSKELKVVFNIGACKNRDSVLSRQETSSAPFLNFSLLLSFIHVWFSRTDLQKL